jgi:hypothetical protein
MACKYTMRKADAIAAVEAIAAKFPGGQRSADSTSYRHDNYPGAGGLVAITAHPSPRVGKDGVRRWRTIGYA